jgi:hypothetical protein
MALNDPQLDDYCFEVFRFPPILWTIFTPIFTFICIWYKNDSDIYLIILGLIYILYTFLGVLFDCNVEMYNYNVRLKPYDMTSSLEKAMIGSKIIMKSHSKLEKDIETQLRDENNFKAMIYTGNSKIVKFLIWITYFLGITVQIFVWDGDIIIPQLEENEKRKKQLQKDKINAENIEKKRIDTEKKNLELEQKRKIDETNKILQRKSIIMLTTKIATIISAKLITLNSTRAHLIKLLSDIEFDVDIVNIRGHSIENDHISIDVPNIIKTISNDSYDVELGESVYCQNNQSENKIEQNETILDNFISALLFVPKKIVGI